MTKLSAITLAALCTLTLAAPAAHANTTLRLSTYVNEADVRYNGFKKFAELVAAKTAGRVKVEIFASSTLHGWSESVDAVLGGVSDISWMPADKRLPCYRATSLYPMVVDMSKQIELDAAYAALMKDEAAKVGLVPLINLVDWRGLLQRGRSKGQGSSGGGGGSNAGAQQHAQHG